MTAARPCRLCGRTIVTIDGPTRHDRPIVVDAFLSLWVVNDKGRVIRATIPHWATCPGTRDRTTEDTTGNRSAYLTAARMYAEAAAYGADPSDATYAVSAGEVVIRIPRTHPAGVPLTGVAGHPAAERGRTFHDGVAGTRDFVDGVLGDGNEQGRG